MKRTSWSAGLSVSGDGTGVVAHAGSAGLRLLADRSGLTGAVSAALAWRSFWPVHDRGQVLADVAETCCSQQFGSTLTARSPYLKERMRGVRPSFQQHGKSFGFTRSEVFTKLRELTHTALASPKNPSTRVSSALGGVNRNRRSRNRLARSQDVSEANEQQWQAAPCRKSSGPLGVRMAQTGSDEHRDARRSADFTIPCSLRGSESATRPPKRALALVRPPGRGSGIAVVAAVDVTWIRR